MPKSSSNNHKATNSTKSQRESLHVTFDCSVLERIRKQAAAEKRSANSKIELLVEQALEQQQPN
jgi:hypothetical protein